MRIVTLMENTACCQDMLCEHGLSLYIETENGKILFDAGQTGAFADNAQKLGIDLADVDVAILSHGHFDHSGGLERFLQINEKAPVYLHKDCFLPRCNADGMPIGIADALRASDRLVYVQDDVCLRSGMMLYSCQNQPLLQPVESYGLQVLENGRQEPDDFHHELYLVIEEQGKRICFSGCSHRGIVNIACWLRPDVLFGGFHFMRLDPTTEDRAVLDRAAEMLLEQDCVYYTGHCTGKAQFDYMKTKMADRLRSVSAGVEVEIR